MIFIANWKWLIDNFNNPGITDWIPWYVRLPLGHLHLLILCRCFLFVLERGASGLWGLVPFSPIRV